MSERERIGSILKKHRNIVVVGLSRNPLKDSNRVARYLRANGYRIIPVNPYAEEVLGEKCYKSLLDMPEHIQRQIDIVDIFRPSGEVLGIVKQAVELRRKYGKPYVVWTQLGIVDQEAADLARREGLEVIMDRCIMIELRRERLNDLTEVKR